MDFNINGGLISKHDIRRYSQGGLTIIAVLPLSTKYPRRFRGGKQNVSTEKCESRFSQLNRLWIQDWLLVLYTLLPKSSVGWIFSLGSFFLWKNRKKISKFSKRKGNLGKIFRNYTVDKYPLDHSCEGGGGGGDSFLNFGAFDPVFGPQAEKFAITYPGHLESPRRGV